MITLNRIRTQLPYQRDNMDWMNLLRSRVASWPTATPSTWYSSTFHEKRFLLTMWAQVCRDEWAKRALGGVMIRPTRTVLKVVYEVDSWSSSAINPFLPTTAFPSSIVSFTFLDASTHLYNRSCLSVRWSMHPISFSNIENGRFCYKKLFKWH